MQNKVYYGRWENGELSLLAFSLFYCLRKGQIRQKRHVDNCGSYEKSHILRNWRIWQGFIKGLAKHLSATAKEAYWQLAIFTKMAYWRKWGIGEESSKGLANLKRGDKEVNLDKWRL